MDKNDQSFVKISSVTANASILYKELTAFTHMIVLLKESVICNGTLGRVCYVIINL